MCQCPSGWGGEDCSDPSCPRHADGALCSNRGACLLDPNAEISPDHAVYTCLCEEGATGEACEKTRCPKDCSGHGACLDGRCFCLPRFSGDACDVLP